MANVSAPTKPERPACPRHPSRPLDRIALNGHEPFEALRCVTCEGCWVGPSDLVRASPAFEQIRLHPDAVMKAAHRSLTRLPCPVCGAVMAHFHFFEVAIDWCSACNGVWLDGGELAQLAENVRAARERGGSDSHATYRTAAVEAVEIGTVRCRRCAKTVPVRDSVVTSGGALCVPCSSEQEGTAASDDAVAATQRELDDARRRAWSETESAAQVSWLEAIGGLLRLIIPKE